MAGRRAPELFEDCRFLAFVYLIVVFHRRCVKANVFNHKVKVVVYCLYRSAFLILFRNTFRTASFFYPPSSTAHGKEWIYWVLQVVPMLINSSLFNVYPPLRYLSHNNKIYLAVDGKTELEGPGMVEKKPFLLTLSDPSRYRRSGDRAKQQEQVLGEGRCWWTRRIHQSCGRDRAGRCHGGEPE